MATIITDEGARALIDSLNDLTDEDVVSHHHEHLAQRPACCSDAQQGHSPLLYTTSFGREFVILVTEMEPDVYVLTARDPGEYRL